MERTECGVQDSEWQGGAVTLCIRVHNTHPTPNATPSIHNLHTHTHTLSHTHLESSQVGEVAAAHHAHHLPGVHLHRRAVHGWVQEVCVHAPLPSCITLSSYVHLRRGSWNTYWLQGRQHIPTPCPHRSLGVHCQMRYPKPQFKGRLRTQTPPKTHTCPSTEGMQKGLSRGKRHRLASNPSPPHHPQT